MLKYKWSEEKNRLLKKERNIGFEQIVIAVEEGKLIDVINNPSSNYENQKVMIIEINSYILLVPFIQNGKEVFLKTMIPNRKYTKKYMK